MSDKALKIFVLGMKKYMKLCSKFITFRVVESSAGNLLRKTSLNHIYSKCPTGFREIVGLRCACFQLSNGALPGIFFGGRP